jgi:translocation and assembly module TamB
VAALGGLLVLLAALAGAVRFGVLTDEGRRLVESTLDGLSLGTYGRLHVEGLGGDLWEDFTIRRLVIADAQGTWLDARGVRLRWDWAHLLRRSLSIDEADADKVTVLRRPRVSPSGGGGPSSVSLELKKFAARLELAPAFSGRYGLYDAAGALEVKRTGGVAGFVNAVSLTHAGDRLGATFDLGRDKTIRLALDVREAQGGALAGSAGLPADQPFFVSATAGGTVSNGRFQLTSRSGQTVPAVAQGAWTPQGGEADGRITLAASRWLAGYQRMLGPVAQFRITGVKAADGLSALNATLSAENIDATAVGEADIGRQMVGPKGMAVTALVRQAQRVLAWPAMGAARFSGTLSGRRDVGDVAGQLVVQQPAALGYRLAQVSGPARLAWDRAGLTAQATLDGQGGQGAGVIAALLGGRPRAAAELSFLPDGRLLMRSLAVTGPGLAIQGTGERGLLGGLSFKGAARFSNFAVAHQGAKGLMAVNWTAGQSGSGPWNVTVDAHAQGFASGVHDLDRLVGAQPSLKGRAAWDGHAFQIAQADLTGLAGSAHAAGTLGGDGALALKLGWAAKGPIDVGPLEITGAGDGVGALTGSLGAPRADLEANFDRVDLPQLPLTKAHVTLTFLKGPTDTDGLFNLAAASPYGAAHASTGFRFAGDGLDLTDVAVDAGGAHAAGSASLRRGTPSSADLAVSLGPGAFLSRGEASGHLTITEAGGAAQARLRLAAVGAATREGGLLIEKANLLAEGPLDRLPYRVDASGYSVHGSWRGQGGGLIAAKGGDYTVSFDGAGRARDADFKTLQPAILTFGSHGQSLNALAEVGGGRAQVDFEQSGETLRAKAALTGVGLGLLDQDMGGRFDATLSLQGAGARLDGALDAHLSGAVERGSTAAAIGGEVKAILAGQTVTIDGRLGNGQGLTSRAHLVLPAIASAAPFHIALIRTEAMQGDFAADGQIKPLWDLLMGGERALAGNVHAVGTISGTLADPQARGEASINGGQFSDSVTGLKLTNVSLAARLDQTAVDVIQFSGQDGAGGQVSGQGRISLERAGASSFRLTLNRFRLIDNDTATAVASGDATLSRDAQGVVKLAGALRIDRADVAANPPTPSGVTPMDVVEINRQPGVGGHLQTVNSHAPSVALDVTLKAARGIYLKGRGLNVEMSLDAQVTGTTAAPQLSGAARMVLGDYDFAGKRFRFDDRGLVTLATSPDKMRLDLTATRDDPSLTAVIQIQGTAAKPTITLSSTPVLPSDEVLSQVLFGTSSSQLSPLDAATLASAMSSLAGGAGFDVTGNLRNFAHLDRLALGGDSTGAIVSGGKYVTKNIYIEVAGGTTGPTGAVEWRVRRDVSVISRLASGSGGDSQIEVRWRKDY